MRSRQEFQCNSVQVLELPVLPHGDTLLNLSAKLSILVRPGTLYGRMLGLRGLIPLHELMDHFSWSWYDFEEG